MTSSLATRDEQPTVGQFITRLQPEIARALPRGMDADRIARLALTVVRQDQNLARCVPESFGGALLTAAALGLEPGVNGECYLVPYKRECTLIIGYQGMAKLFWQHPLAAGLDSQPVYENDEFVYRRGLHPVLEHTPNLSGDRGKVTHYYAVAMLSTGATAFEVLTADDVKRLRGGKSGPSGQIPDPMRWMERKTALRQLFKLVPKSTTLSAAIAVDEQRGTALLSGNVPEAISRGESFAALPPSVTEQAQQEEDAHRVHAAEIVEDGTE